MITLDLFDKPIRDGMRKLAQIAADRKAAALAKITENPFSALEWGAGDDLLQVAFYERISATTLGARLDLSDDVLHAHAIGDCLQALMHLSTSSSTAANNLRHQEAIAAAELLRSLGVGYSHTDMARRMVEGSKVIDARNAQQRKETVWKVRIEKIAHRKWRIVHYNADMEPLTIIENMPSSEHALRRHSLSNINPAGGLWVFSPTRNDYVRK